MPDVKHQEVFYGFSNTLLNWTELDGLKDIEQWQ